MKAQLAITGLLLLVAMHLSSCFLKPKHNFDDHRGVYKDLGVSPVQRAWLSEKERSEHPRRWARHHRKAAHKHKKANKTHKPKKEHKKENNKWEEKSYTPDTAAAIKSSSALPVPATTPAPDTAVHRSYGTALPEMQPLPAAGVADTASSTPPAADDKAAKKDKKKKKKSKQKDVEQ